MRVRACKYMYKESEANLGKHLLMQPAFFKPFSMGLSKIRSSKNSNRKMTLTIHMKHTHTHNTESIQRMRCKRRMRTSMHTCAFAQWHAGHPGSKQKVNGRGNHAWVWHVSGCPGWLRTRSLKKTNLNVSLIVFIPQTSGFFLDLFLYLRTL